MVLIPNAWLGAPMHDVDNQVLMMPAITRIGRAKARRLMQRIRALRSPGRAGKKDVNKADERPPPSVSVCRRQQARSDSVTSFFSALATAHRAPRGQARESLSGDFAGRTRVAASPGTALPYVSGHAAAWRARRAPHRDTHLARSALRRRVSGFQSSACRRVVVLLG